MDLQADRRVIAPFLPRGVWMATAIGAEPELNLKVKYSGPAADMGRMNALDLGPAIFGIGEMVGQASRILYNDESRIRVDVRADFEHASFGIEFLAIAPAGIGGLTLEQLKTVAELLGLAAAGVVGTVKGVIGLYRWQKGRAIDKVVPLPNGGMQLTINAESITVPITQYNVYIDSRVRDGFKALTDPMKRDGVDSVSLTAEGNPPEVITKEERENFDDPPLPEAPVSIDKSTAILEIVSISFREGNKWRFAQGDSATFYAEILDAKFLRDVEEQREQFASGDALRVEMEIETKREGRQLRYERRILHVIEHLRADGGGQIPLL